MSLEKTAQGSVVENWGEKAAKKLKNWIFPDTSEADLNRCVVGDIIEEILPLSTLD